MSDEFITSDAGEAAYIVTRLQRETGDCWPFLEQHKGRWVFRWNDPEGNLSWMHKEYDFGKAAVDDLQAVMRFEKQLRRELGEAIRGTKKQDGHDYANHPRLKKF